jgi:hypothetical protein
MLFALVQQLFLPRSQQRNQPRPFLSPDAAAWLIETLAVAESLLRWAILRQAFRLCGLAPSTARYIHLKGADTPEAWAVRRRTLLAMLRTMSAHARSQAARIREALAGNLARAARPDAPADFTASGSGLRTTIFRQASFSTIPTTTIFSGTTIRTIPTILPGATTTIFLAPVAIRGPPWPELHRKSQPDPTRRTLLRDRGRMYDEAIRTRLPREARLFDP